MLHGLLASFLIPAYCMKHEPVVNIFKKKKQGMNHVRGTDL